MTHGWYVTVAVTLALLCFAGPAAGEVRLPAILSDHMVLQCETTTSIWGWADPQEAVRVSTTWSDVVEETTADADGEWRVRVRTPGVGGPYRITVAGSNTLTIDDVLVGEVWVCSGQSNMEWSFVSGVEEGERLRSGADHPQVRLFDVERQLAVVPQEDCKGSWRVCTPETVSYFSAVGYFFGREIHEALKAPVGLIGSNWGGTVAEAWMSEEAVRAHGGFAESVDELALERAAPGALAKRHGESLKAFWGELARRDPGSGSAGWMKADFDDGGWSRMEVPGYWSADGLDAFDGVVWFRRRVEIPAGWSGRALALDLGPIDDRDTVWFNGQRIGGLEGAGYHWTPRSYTVPADVVRAGENVLVVRVLDLGGPGGLFGKAEQVVLRDPAGGSDARIELAGPWRYRVGAAMSALGRWPSGEPMHPNRPTVLFNGMIAPLTRHAIRGAIWYQGESNCERAMQYQTLFPALIADWRHRWGVGDFPFYFVQIAPFEYHGDRGAAAALRDAQRRALAMPNTGMAVTMDIGNPADIHPRNKVDVGRRLAGWALAKTYGREDVVYSGPLYREMVVEGGRVRLRFEHAEGLSAGGPLDHFQISGADRQFVPARAEIEGETVVVWSEKVDKPVAVRYAWGAADEPGLANGAGLPMACFRTDNWPTLELRQAE